MKTLRKPEFKEFLSLSCEGKHFTCDGTLYKQTDGGTVGLPFWPIGQLMPF